MTSYPFKPETKPTVSPIDEAIERLRNEHKANRENHRIAFEHEAELAWQRSEEKRKSMWLADYKERLYLPLPYPYKDYSRNAQFRVSLPYNSRIDLLAAQELYEECLVCLMARRTADTNYKTTVAVVQQWFEPYIPVEGEHTITTERPPGAGCHTSTTIVQARGLSKVLAEILAGTSRIETQRGEVRWFPPDPLNLEEF